MSSRAYTIYLFLTLVVTASKSYSNPPSQACKLKANTLIVEGSIKVSCAAECQARCQQDDCCQFFTYNKASKGCGLRNFVPQARAFSLGNISGLKNESPLIWTKVSNSVYVAKIFKTNSADDCQSICLADNDCKAMIYNKLLGQCSLNIGEGPYREIPLGNQSQFGISSCIKLGGGGTGNQQSNSILIAGGYKGFQARKPRHFDESEALLVRNCSLPDLPSRVMENGLTTTVNSEGISKIISCGGDLNGDQNNRQRTKDCYTLEAGTNGDKKWTYYNSFTEVLGGEGFGIKSIFMPKKGTYIFGDIKSQFLPVGSTKWQPGPDSRQIGGFGRFNDACVVPINDEEFLVMGGNGQDRRKRVTKYNVTSGQSSDLPALNVGRLHPGCALFTGGSSGDYVLIAGGITSDPYTSYGKSTEIYYIASGRSEIAGDLNRGRRHHALVTVKSPKQTIYALGGNVGRLDNPKYDDGSTDTVEEWDESTKTWKETSIKLNQKKARFGALAVDSEVICPN